MDIEQIRVRIMSEAYDLADRGDLEGYNAIKVMCSDVLELIAAVVVAEREACAKLCDEMPLREWVGLTDEDKEGIKNKATYNWDTTAGEYASEVQALTEAKLKEKNT